MMTTCSLLAIDSGNYILHGWINRNSAGNIVSTLTHTLSLFQRSGGGLGMAKLVSRFANSRRK